jgi:glyoxylase-like metal-dependent hydrolase (beta-lactamase superfamily II)
MKFALRSIAVAAALAVATLAFTGATSGNAYAAAPMVKISAPAYYRAMLGDFEITALCDGILPVPVEKIMTNTTPDKVKAQLAKHYLKTPLDFSVNAFLVNSGSKLVLIDTGTGGSFGPTAGTLIANLKAAGYQPEQVDEIYITHMHGDHIGGLLADGKAAFPNAIVRADKGDADYWLNQANMDKAPADAKGGFKGAMMVFEPYIKTGHFRPFEGETKLVPGVTALPQHGHTPGHSTYMVESKGEKLLLWGDLMHVAAVQFEHPEVTIQFDSDSKAAAAQRKKVFADAAKQGYLIGAAHISFPGLGHMRADGKGYRWEPVNYTPVHADKANPAAKP